jgi:replicative DNA helicase
MTDLTKSQKAALQSIQEDARWDVVEIVKKQLQEEFSITKVGGIDAYSELKSLHMQQGRKEGLERLFEALDNEARN